ncbi:MAG: M48 family metalloprotease [Candidatus Aminicenantales bacterium]
MNPLTKSRPDFYEVQKQQQKRTLLILTPLVLFYFVSFGLILLAGLVSFAFILATPLTWSSAFVGKWMAALFIAALGIGLVHYWGALRTGALYILKRLDARPPDSSDRYHLQFSNAVEEMRIASGLRRVKAYVLPQFASNSLALVEPDGTCSVLVTEGLLADSTRDELQAVVAHELAHISRGDTFYVTLVCSLANILEKWREALEPEDSRSAEAIRSEKTKASPALLYIVLVFSSLVMHILSMWLSREREILADAAAVEICRHPQALARALYKAHLKSSLIGDFGLAYSPLFIVAPGLTGESDGFFSRLFNSHPPLMKRVKLLARMARLEPAHIIRQVWEEEKQRTEARTVLTIEGERRRDLRTQPENGPTIEEKEEKAWLIQDKEGKWQGPFTRDELFDRDDFTLSTLVQNRSEGIKAQAREFPQIRLALERPGKKILLDPSKKGLCPRCHEPLIEIFYEGVAIKACPACGGKLVQASRIERILLRREFTFSDALIQKARTFQEQFLLNPIKKQREKEREARGLTCPTCGYRLSARPYNYQYFVPVDKCLNCGEIWFDADELEMLQVLIEKKA